MKKLILFIVLSFVFVLSSHGQRSYSAKKNATTGKYDIRIEGVTTDDNGVKRGEYTLTEIEDTASVTAYIQRRLAVYEQAVTQAQAQLTALTMERDSITKLLSNWWADYGDLSFQAAPSLPTKPPNAPTEKANPAPSKKTKARKPKTKKQ